MQWKILETIFGGSAKQDMHIAQKQYVLNVILVGLILLFGLLTVLSSYYRWYYGSAHTGESPIYVGLTWIGFVVVYCFSKKGWLTLASWLLFAIFLIFANAVSAKSGTENPISLLLFAWVFTLIGILFERKTALILYIFSAVNIMAMTYFQIVGKIIPDLHWKIEKLDFGISFSHVLILLIIALISSLYNRQITNSLTRALKSEVDLQKERDLLEIRVIERTEDLKKSQMEEIKNLSRFAEFGRNMSGLIHDLVNPLTAISLNLGQLTNHPNLSEIKKYSQNALKATGKMGELIRATRQKLQKKPERLKIHLRKRVADLQKLWELQLKNSSIKIKIDCPKNALLLGSPTGFDQIVQNLVSNSIDAYQKHTASDKVIIIQIKESATGIDLEITDFAGGIKETDLKNVFKPFFSTKKNKRNQGIGLYIIKNIIENDFGGTIKVSSQIGEGTKFSIYLPKRS